MRPLHFALILLASSSTLACAQPQGPSSLGTRYEHASAPDRATAGEAKRRTANSAGSRDSARADPPASSPAGGSYGGFEGEASWDDRRDSIAVDERPGLGTAYGESRRSSVETVGFRRANPSTPDVVFEVRYDDVDGVRAAAAPRRTRSWSNPGFDGARSSDALQQHGGLSFALLDARGEILPAAVVAGDLWALGQPDARYSLAIANDTSSAFEVVASVDGLDVIDGRPASFGKRGYIVDPFSSVVIDGWRTSEDTVAAFRFSAIEDSYAERMGDGRNVGVIGAAFFREAAPSRDGWDRWSPPADTWRRETADPFPGR
jgi:hypothetical protein